MNIIGKRLLFFIISGVILVAGLVSLGVFGLKPGIEFSSGSLVTVSVTQHVEVSDLKKELTTLGYPNALVQSVGETGFIIRLPTLNETAKNNLVTGLTTQFPTMQVQGIDTTSPIVASETVRDVIIAVIIASLGMLLYITWAFRKMPRPLHYGTCAVIALMHDTLVAVGVYSILGAFLGWEINLMFITGILAVIGYSVNNTVVVFDRIRENVKKGISTDFETVVNSSVVETLGRCLNTSMTTIITILAVLLFVGASIQAFTTVLLIGTVAGTFDSICIAPSLLVVWDKWEKGRVANDHQALATAKR